MVGGNYGLVHVIVFGRSSVIIIKRLRVLQVLGVGEHPPLMVSIIPVKVISGFLLRLLKKKTECRREAVKWLSAGAGK